MKEKTPPLYFKQSDIPLTLQETCNPGKVALLVYDAQAGIINQIKNNQNIVNGLIGVITAARNAGIRIYFSRHITTKRVDGNFSNKDGNAVAKS